MIYVTQLVYLKPGQEKDFDEFEAIAIPIIARYNGKLLFRLRPEPSSFIESSIQNPYEVHLVEFASKEDFERFKTDDERKKYTHLKDQSVAKSVLIEGVRL